MLANGNLVYYTSKFIEILKMTTLKLLSCLVSTISRTNLNNDFKTKCKYILLQSQHWPDITIILKER